MSRLVVLDTETTGLETALGHKIIEIGAVELVNRRLTGRQFHKYLNPGREIDAAAQEVHGLSLDFLGDKPAFADVADEFMTFINGAELVIHNATFDITFLDYEFKQLNSRFSGISKSNRITDSLALARHKHPGQKNNLDTLCRRYGIDNSARALHGALLDAEILADVYLVMTGGQTALFAQANDESGAVGEAELVVSLERPAALPVIQANGTELAAHQAMLDVLDRGCEEGALWRRALAN